MSQIKIKQVSGLQDIINTPVPIGIEYVQESEIMVNTSGNNFPTGIILDYTPFSDSIVQLKVNGLLVDSIDVSSIDITYYSGNQYMDLTTGFENGVLGNFYFSNDGGVTAKSEVSLEAGDELYWNGLINYQLNGPEEILDSGGNLIETKKGDIITIVYDKEYLSNSVSEITSKIDTEMTVLSNDFLSANVGGIYPFNKAGTVVKTNLMDQNHPGVVIIKAGSLYLSDTGSGFSSFKFTDKLQMDCIFTLPTDTSNNSILMGFFGYDTSFNFNGYNNGIYYKIVDNVLICQSEGGGFATFNSEPYTLVSNVWYHARIKLNFVGNYKSAIFSIYDMNGIELFSHIFKNQNFSFDYWRIRYPTWSISSSDVLPELSLVPMIRTSGYIQNISASTKDHILVDYLSITVPLVGRRSLIAPLEEISI